MSNAPRRPQMEHLLPPTPVGTVDPHPSPDHDPETLAVITHSEEQAARRRLPYDASSGDPLQSIGTEATKEAESAQDREQVCGQRVLREGVGPADSRAPTLCTPRCTPLRVRVHVQVRQAWATRAPGVPGEVLPAPARIDAGEDLPIPIPASPLPAPGPFSVARASGRAPQRPASPPAGQPPP